MILDFKISSLAGKVKLSRSQLVELVKMNGERHVGVALDYSPRGRYALHWAVENILRAIDHFIVVVVNQDGLEAGRAGLWEASGTCKESSCPFLPETLHCGGEFLEN